MIRITVPPITRTILATIIALSLINAYLRYATYSSLYRLYHLYELEPSAFTGVAPVAPEWSQIVVPFLTMAPRITSLMVSPITLLTSPFVETSVHGLLISLLIITTASSYIEKSWNDSTQYFRFVTLSTLAPYLITTLVTLALYRTNPTQATLDKPSFIRVIHGSIPLQMALLVALTQAIPQHNLVLFKMPDLLKLRVKHTPLALFILYAFMDILGIDSNEGTVLLAWNGLCFGWFYLRFMRSISPHHNSNPTVDADSLPIYDVPPSNSETATNTPIYGDASDTFAFAHLFFPASVRTVVDGGASMVAVGVSHLINLAPKGLVGRLPVSFATLGVNNNSNTDGSSNVSTGAPVGGPTPADLEAERRRALALKVLEQRLAGQP